MDWQLQQTIAGWRINEGCSIEERIERLLESLFARGWLPDKHPSSNAILLGEQYHLGGAEDTRGMAELVGVAVSDRMIDLACYVGGPARQLARDYGCEVVGVDISPVHIAVARALTSLCGLENRVAFICASADAVPLRDASFTVAWSQCSFPSDLSWLTDMHRLLAPGGRMAFTLPIRRSDQSPPELPSLEAAVDKVTDVGYRPMCAEDISEWEIEHGWLPARRKLGRNEAHYAALMGEDWVRKAFESLDADIAAWQSGSMGNGRIVAVKEGQ